MTEDQLKTEFGDRLTALFGEDYGNHDGYKAVVTACVVGSRPARNVLSELEQARQQSDSPKKKQGGYYGRGGW